MKITKEAIHTDTEALASKMADLTDAVADAPSEWPEQSKSTDAQISVATAVYGLLGFLSTSDKPVTFSSKHNADFIVDLAKAFLEANKIDEDPDFNNYQPPKWEPQEKEWNGEGLPPIGVEFELKPYWNRVKVIAHDEREDGTYIVYWGYHIQEYGSCIRPNYFRPIQSTAERKRDDLKYEISNLIAREDTSDTDYLGETIADWLIVNDMIKADE